MNARVFQAAIGIACTLFFLALALYRVRLGAVGEALAGAPHIWIGAARPNVGLLVHVLVTGSALFGAILIAALYLSGSMTSRVVGRFPGVSAQMAMARQGFEILWTWRTLEIVAITLMTYIPDALSLWLLVKAVGMTLSFPDTLVLVGAASLSTLVPSGPAFLGTLQFAYALAIEFAGGARALGIAAATLAQLCVLVPLALIAAGVLAHGSGRFLAAAWGRRQAERSLAEETLPVARAGATNGNPADRVRL